MSTMPHFRATLGLILLATILVAAGLAPGGARPAQAIAAPYAPDQVVAQLKPGGTATIEALNADYGTTTLGTMTVIADTYLLATPPGEDAAITLTRMRGDPRLAFVEPNYLSGAPKASPRKIQIWGGLSAAPQLEQYALEQLNINEAHELSRGAGVTVAVIDTGFQLDHPALAGNMLSNGFDFIDGDATPEDVTDGLDNDGNGLIDEAFGHGTHVAGIVLLAAPEAMILPIRALNADGDGDVYSLAMAIEYAVANGAQIINLSLGTFLQSDLLHQAVLSATRSGVLVVAAAGNTGGDFLEFPAADPCAVGVTSIDESNGLAPEAALGPWVDLAASGESIYSALPPGGYGWWSGTSMATPFVSGQAALLRASRDDLSLRQLTSIMAVASKNLDTSHSDNYPARIINIGQSVALSASDRHFSGRHSFIAPECTLSVASDITPIIVNTP